MNFCENKLPVFHSYDNINIQKGVTDKRLAFKTDQKMIALVEGAVIFYRPSNQSTISQTLQMQSLMLKLHTQI